MNNGANINKENYNCETPLFDACCRGNIDIIKYLVSHGAKINGKSNEGETQFLAACSSGIKVMVKCFNVLWIKRKS